MAAELVATGEKLGPLKGAPLALLARRRAFLAPRACSSPARRPAATYAFTGEGIGKAMETGILAAETIAEPRATR